MREARELFLTGDDGRRFPFGSIRAEIKASWARSQQLAVNADRVEPAYVEQLDDETLLARCAAPVVVSVENELAGEPIGILVTDAHGTVLDRRCPDPHLTRLLDAARLAPGFVFAESSVGTNGIGTAIEMRTPTMVTGAEHFVESLKQFGCAGATVRHPITGAFLGIVDFTARAAHVNPLLLTLARATAQRVQDQLLSQASAREVALLQDYMAACHHTGGSVLAVSEGLVMMNGHTQQHYDLADQAALLARLGEAADAGERRTQLAQLPSGSEVRLDYRPVRSGDQLAGGVVRVQPTRVREPHPRAARVATSALPGVVGTSVLWQRCVRLVLSVRRRGEWLVLEGEPGVGKGLLARAVQQAHQPGSWLTVLDAADLDPARAEAAKVGAVDDWLEQVSEAVGRRSGGLLLLHGDQLPAALVAAVAERLGTERVGNERMGNGTGRDAGTWVAVTVRAGARPAVLETDLVPRFGQTIEVPPLRQHLDDLDRLVTHLLDRMVHGSQLSVSAPAANQLRRLPWPGNVEQLRQMLAQAARRRRLGVITSDDLPPGAHAVSRHQLSVLESLERDAIVAALVASDGRKEVAAQSLGVSRATIYRKIKAYGIVTG